MRLLSYNIHKGVGGRDRRYRLERIIAVIEHEQPDLICLHEVTHGAKRSRFHDQAKLLADHFGFAGVAFQMNVRWKVGGYGNLLLSRWPLEEHHHLSLRMGNKKPRGAQLAIIRTPEGALRLVNWHLGLAERERHWQVKHLLSHRHFHQAAGPPTLIVGDFNDWRNTLSAGALAEAGLHHLTSPPSRFRSFPAWLPLGSLDKAFACERIVAEHVRVVRTRLSRSASDHLPLVVDFSLLLEGFR